MNHISKQDPAICILEGQDTLATRLPECSPPEMTTVVPRGIKKVLDQLQTLGVTKTGPAYCRYLEHWKDRGTFVLEVGVPVSTGVKGSGDVIASRLPGGKALSIIHAGRYETLGDSFARLDALVAEKGLKPAGAPWEAYIITPDTEPDPAGWRTRLYQPVTS